MSHLVLIECYLDVDKFKSEGFEIRVGEFFDGFRNALIELKGEFMIEKVRRRVENYYTFFTRPDDLEPIDTTIHFIKAEDKVEVNEPLGWERLTYKGYCVYNGFGGHEEMLSAAYAAKNAEIVKNILD